MNSQAIVTLPRSFGGSTIHVTSGMPGDLVLPANLAVVRAGGVETVLVVTSWLGSVITVSGPAAGVTDANVVVGDALVPISGAYLPLAYGDAVDSQGRALGSLTGGAVTGTGSPGSIAVWTDTGVIGNGVAAAALAPLASPTFTGTVTVPTLAVAVHRGTIHTDTDASTVTMDMSISDKHTLLTTSGVGSARTVDFSNVTAGQTFEVEVTQAGSGGPYTVTWDSSVVWSGGTPPTLATGASKHDLLVFSCRSTGVCAGAISIPNY